GRRHAGGLAGRPASARAVPAHEGNVPPAIPSDWWVCDAAAPVREYVHPGRLDTTHCVAAHGVLRVWSLSGSRPHGGARVSEVNTSTSPPLPRRPVFRSSPHRSP